ncbi:MAG: TraR/DksA C4-type zinc finger protein [Deltaproteobacteria bacterium]|nr:TraR/DksA C4-type zinc finger protein [Deltaproteobacteria bacterium]
MALNETLEPVELTNDELNKQRTVLIDKREKILQAMRTAEMQQDPDELRVADEMDLSSVGYDQAFEYRLRDRDATLIKKIDKAIRRIDAGEYNFCEECDAIIGAARLIARPETDLCIQCKEKQEHHEKMYEKRRQRMTSFEA